MADNTLEAAKRRYSAALADGLDPEECARIALLTADRARDARDFETARHHAQRAVEHLRQAGVARGRVRAQRKLAGALLQLRQWEEALPLLDEVLAAPDEPQAELPSLKPDMSAQERALEDARALAAWGSGALPQWTSVWGQLADAFADQAIAPELERRFLASVGRAMRGKRRLDANLLGALRAQGYPRAALLAAQAALRQGAREGWLQVELGLAQEATGNPRAAYDSLCAGAVSLEAAPPGGDEEDDDEGRDEDAFASEAFEAWLDAVRCAVRLGDRAKMRTAYDRAALLRMDPGERAAYERLRTQARAPEASRTQALEEVLRTDLRFYATDVPEGRDVLRRVLTEHLEARREASALALLEEVLESKATVWGDTSPAYHLACFDLGKLLLRVGAVSRARPVLRDALEGLRAWAEEEDVPLDDAHPFVAMCLRALAEVEKAVDTELLEAVRTDSLHTVGERLERIRELLARGASLQARDADGDTALHHAARRPEADADALVRALLDLGASCTTPNARGALPLHLAIAQPADAPDLVQALCAEGLLRSEPRPLRLAAEHGRAVVVARLLALGAAPEEASGGVHDPVVQRLLAQAPRAPAPLLEFAVRVSHTTGNSTPLEAQLSGATLSEAEVHPLLLGFCAHLGRAAMERRFGEPEAGEKAVKKLLEENVQAEALERVVAPEWEHASRGQVALLLRSLPPDVRARLGEEAQLLAGLERGFRASAYDAAPPALRKAADPARYGKPPGAKRPSRGKAKAP